MDSWVINQQNILIIKLNVGNVVLFGLQSCTLSFVYHINFHTWVNLFVSVELVLTWYVLTEFWFTSRQFNLLTDGRCGHMIVSDCSHVCVSLWHSESKQESIKSSEKRSSELMKSLWERGSLSGFRMRDRIEIKMVCEDMPTFVLTGRRHRRRCFCTLWCRTRWIHELRSVGWKSLVWLESTSGCLSAVAH